MAVQGLRPCGYSCALRGCGQIKMSQERSAGRWRRSYRKDLVLRRRICLVRFQNNARELREMVQLQLSV